MAPHWPPCPAPTVHRDQAGWHLTPTRSPTTRPGADDDRPSRPGGNGQSSRWWSSFKSWTSSRCAAKPVTTSSTSHHVPRHAQMRMGSAMTVGITCLDRERRTNGIDWPSRRSTSSTRSSAQCGPSTSAAMRLRRLVFVFAPRRRFPGRPHRSTSTGAAQEITVSLRNRPCFAAGSCDATGVSVKHKTV